MPEQEGQHIIQAFRKKWQRNYFVAALLLAFGVAALLTTVLYLFIKTPLWIIAPVFAAAAVIIYWLRPFRRITQEDITSFLNRHYPQLEESSHLILQPPSSLSFLQQLQQQKIEPIIKNIAPPAEMFIPVKRAGLVVFAVIIVCAIGFAAQISFVKNDHDHNERSAAAANVPKEAIPAGVKSVSVEITPPAYTGRKKREQEQLSLKVEEGSNISWTINTSGIADSVILLFNNREHIAMKRSSTDSNEWQLQRNVKETGFYQVQILENPSPLYTLEVIHDQPADIRIITPQQYTTIEPGRRAISNLRVHLSDDYGITNTQIIATKASGKGESVSFKEQQLSFAEKVNGQRDIELSKTIDLAAMGMQGGDELYFYIKATDNHGQESRSDMYFISLPDTAELLNMSGMESGVNQFPEYFRSQRQLIIDTEKLLKEQSGLSKDTFNARSNDLGIEQKLLRLRYGKFLGEENESGGGHSPDDGHDHGTEPAYGDVQSLIDQYAHKHDNAEDATFLEPEQKAQLKGVLTEMWNSELKLRTLTPSESLPYQYKALRLLKDLQQKSRAYVSKTSIKMPPLKPEKRLTGNLEKITPPNQPARQVKEDEQVLQLRNAMQVLEIMKQGRVPAASGMTDLFRAQQAIAAKAIAEPAAFLPALSATRSLSEDPSKATRQQIDLVQRAIQSIIKTTDKLPQQQTNSASKLSDYYFKKLNR
ncbi:MAG: hypothetical protein DI535_25635 [Citrobacter freundii]|nr:MAG: hypothetical protein DI535_25635 [Citrobacter freundii]